MGARPIGQCRVIITYLILNFPTLPPSTYLSVSAVCHDVLKCVRTFLVKHFLFLCVVFEFVSALVSVCVRSVLMVTEITALCLTALVFL